ncbi:hypothetical protein [Caulobacter sp. S45]|uniref:hypothetical protein n=1 Tax=Caulobacter sp. S45 TaxID=1641861 RepID=UPI00131C8866|nr:hypothetical protein [Caulobacter sp. S45]
MPAPASVAQASVKPDSSKSLRAIIWLYATMIMCSIILFFILDFEKPAWELPTQADIRTVSGVFMPRAPLLKHAPPFRLKLNSGGYVSFYCFPAETYNDADCFIKERFDPFEQSSANFTVGFFRARGLAKGVMSNGTKNIITSVQLNGRYIVSPSDRSRDLSVYLSREKQLSKHPHRISIYFTVFMLFWPTIWLAIYFYKKWDR